MPTLLGLPVLHPFRKVLNMAAYAISTEHAPALGALREACANPEVNAKIASLVVQGVNWNLILAALVNVVADIAARNWQAVLDELEKLLPQTP